MASYNLEIIQGSTYSIRLVAKNEDGSRFNLSGYNARGYIKYRYSDIDKLLDLQPSVHPSYVSGYIDLNLPATGTAALPACQLLYDIEIYTNSDDVTRVINGYANITPEVTY